MVRKVGSKEVEKATRDLLVERGVSIRAIAEIVLEMQLPYNPNLKIEECDLSVNEVLKKRELQHAILVGVELDKLAEQGLLSEPLQSLVEGDEGLFGVDETIAVGSSFGYGSIAITTFGYLDKHKLGIIKELDTKGDHGSVHTFLDDLVGSIAANASARIAHKARDLEESLENSLE
jgi:phosphatidylglycerophosphatase A